MCPLAHHPNFCRAVKRDEGEVRQIDAMDLDEGLLPQSRIQCRKFLLVEGIQSGIAIEVNIVSLGWNLVAREQGGIVRVIAREVLQLSDVVPARHGSSGWRRLSPKQERAIEHFGV